mgnify:FL=1|jgi:hypothetical protein
MGTTEEDRKRHQEEKIDEAIQETFPASDSAAVGEATGTEPAKRPKDRLPPLISEDEIERARRGDEHEQNDSIKRSR